MASTSRERDKYRKYESGAEKARKKRKRDELVGSQKGSMNRFLISSASATHGDGVIPEDTVSTASCTGDADITEVEVGHMVVDRNQTATTQIGYTLDIYDDPGNWEEVMENKTRDLIVEKGPVAVRVPDNFTFPKDKNNRHFSKLYYMRVLPNGEKVDRKYLVYSKKKDVVFCFCCKLFYSERSVSHLSTDGVNSWKNLGDKLRSHEISHVHILNLQKWIELEKRLLGKQTIDKATQQQIDNEKKHWQSVLVRIIAVVEYLAEHNCAFRGKSERLYTNSNGNFLGLIEMLAKFDPTIQEHIRRIRDGTAHDHYLGHLIQNELIGLMASEVKKKILEKAKAAKYYSVMLDCTPDISHQEQMSLIIRFLDMSGDEASVVEHFLGFLPVDDTTGKGLSDSLLAELDRLGLDIDNCRGQGYDNGANMKGQHQGVQARILQMNPRAFFTPCGCHSLNLVLGDMAKCNPYAMSFFGVIQRIYTLFSHSINRWSILKRHAPILTTKPLSETRWECRLESVKAIRYQTSGIRDALFEVAETSEDPKVKSEANSLATHELESFEFLLGMVLWYDILFAVNTVSKYLQSRDMELGVAVQHINALIKFLEKFRDTGFNSSITTAKEIAEEMTVEPKFRQRRVGRKLKQFDYEGQDEPVSSPETAFKTGYFLCVVDQALVSMRKRFEQFQEYATTFEFLYDLKKFREMTDPDLKKHCLDLDHILQDGDSHDLDGLDFYSELKVFKELIPAETKTALQALNYIRTLTNSFPNTAVAYRILLTIPVTVASAERSFSKLKLIKNYLRSVMGQERLSGLAIISIEKVVASALNYNDLISEFASRKSRKVQFI